MTRVLASCAGAEPEDHDHEEHVGDHEQEHAERDRSREDTAAGLDVSFQGTERGVEHA